MKDTEIRGLLLRKYYERRREGMIGLEPSDFDDQLTLKDILYVSQQLGEHGLIKWAESMGLGGLAAGMGKITAAGVDVVEGGRQSPIAIHFTDKSVRISNSVGVAVGNNNQQTIRIQLKELVEAIDRSDSTAESKREAKSLLQKAFEHPTIAAIIGGIAGAVFTSSAN